MKHISPNRGTVCLHCPPWSRRMCELSSQHTFTPLFAVDNAEPLTNILNLPLKIHLAFVRTNVCVWNTARGDSPLPIRTIVLLYLANTDSHWSLHVWGRRVPVVRILQEEYKDCPADYNLSFEYHTELHCHANSYDWRELDGWRTTTQGHSHIYTLCILWHADG